MIVRPAPLIWPPDNTPLTLFPLTYKIAISYTQTVKKECLINQLPIKATYMEVRN